LIDAVAKDHSEDESDFAALMPGVKRIDNDRINVYQQRVRKSVIAKSRETDATPQADFSSLSFDQQSQINDSHFDHGINRKLQRKIRQGLLDIDDRLDLHGYTQKKAASELSEFIGYALSSRFKLIIIIHGKGNRSSESAVLKPLVHHWLSQQVSVLAWCPAQAKHGGSGASYVYLRQL
jgi:DNA-nicking Smr family endonuclease